jgi:hypothetical protein
LAPPHSGKLIATWIFHTSLEADHWFRVQPIAKIPEVGFVQDSSEIAKALEVKYPSPSIHLSDSRVQAAIEAIGKAGAASAPLIIAQVPGRLLPDYDAEYFNRTREPRFGKPLKQLAAEIDQNKVLADMKEASKDLLALLDEEDGPFFLGKTRLSPSPALSIRFIRITRDSYPRFLLATASYADFFLASYLVWSVSFNPQRSVQTLLTPSCM